MRPKPRKASWRHRRLTRREELASVWVLFLVPALMVALLAPLSWCSPPATIAEMIEPAGTIASARDDPPTTARPSPTAEAERGV